ncbi:DNA-binding LacI/PurR family transcriptional regulator [Rhizobium leguminosarum]
MKGIRELADYLDISIGTVSRALNGKRDVNEETRRRVLAAADELGYVANQSGRSLRQGERRRSSG